MYSSTPTGKASKGSVKVISSDNRLQLRFRFGAKRHYVSIGLSDTPTNRKLAEIGCRPSEALALYWKHIGKSMITFEQALIYDGRGLVLKEGLKTQKARKFPINAQLQSLLEGIQPDGAKPQDLVFPSPKGKYIDWGNFTTRGWSSVLATLPDIEYRNPYQTRHTFCSLCREADIPSIQIAKWVGNLAEMIDRVYAKPTDHIQVPEL